MLISWFVKSKVNLDDAFASWRHSQTTPWRHLTTKNPILFLCRMTSAIADYVSILCCPFMMSDEEILVVKNSISKSRSNDTQPRYSKALREMFHRINPYNLSCLYKVTKWNPKWVFFHSKIFIFSFFSHTHTHTHNAEINYSYQAKENQGENPDFTSPN